MTKICETFNLPESIKNEYVKRLLKNHILTKNKDGIPTITKFFHMAFNSMEKSNFAETIKQAAHNDDFLSNMIRLGGCLIVFGIKNDELFHSLNIIAISMNRPQCRSEDCKKILGWIDYCFPFDKVKDMKKGKKELQKSLNVLDVRRM